MEVKDSAKHGERKKLFCGILTALVTPFKDDELDLKSLANLVRAQLEAGVEGFVVNGTTGESPNLSPKERLRLFDFIRSEVSGAVPLLFGSGSNSTTDTVEQSRLAEKAGADGLLVVVPYYNKPPQKGLVQHFTRVARSVGIPIVLYNVPSRTVVGLDVDSIKTLSEVENIVGIKEASGDLKFLTLLQARLPSSFTLLSGDDVSAVDFQLEGGDGVISVVSHLIPSEMVKISAKARVKDKGAVESYRRFERLNHLLFKEANPIPVKYCLRKMGILETDDLRLPLVQVSEGLSESLNSELRALKLL